MNTTQLRKELRIALASLAEHIPTCAVMIGMFSAPNDGKILYGFWAAGQKKLEERMQLPQDIYYATTLPCLLQEFQEQYHCKPAFGMEWFIFQDAWVQGVVAISDAMTEHIESLLTLHETPPDDGWDIEMKSFVIKGTEPLN